jgi:hypothetical protein
MKPNANPKIRPFGDLWGGRPELLVARETEILRVEVNPELITDGEKAHDIPTGRCEQESRMEADGPDWAVIEMLGLPNCPPAIVTEDGEALTAKAGAAGGAGGSGFGGAGAGGVTGFAGVVDAEEVDDDEDADELDEDVVDGDEDDGGAFDEDEVDGAEDDGDEGDDDAVDAGGVSGLLQCGVYRAAPDIWLVNIGFPTACTNNV